MLQCVDLYFMVDQRDVDAFEELNFSPLLTIIQWEVTLWVLCLGPYPSAKPAVTGAAAVVFGRQTLA